MTLLGAIAADGLSRLWTVASRVTLLTAVEAASRTTATATALGAVSGIVTVYGKLEND